ncbi:MAG TPA: hypothetical protein VHZ03_29710 [Trebonia sp.]|jgi:hypothetical protein|nr:hypothetical protein [Trebonia sp.]
MTASAETIPARVPTPALRQRRYRLSPGLAAVAEAREHVRAAIRDWALPVSADVAVLATWDLVTSLLTEGPGGADGTEGPAGPGAVTLGISGSGGRLRVDAYDGRRYRWGTPGLAIVASLTDEWGRYRTPGGRAAYFCLAFSSSSAAPGSAAVGDTSAD